MNLEEIIKKEGNESPVVYNSITPNKTNNLLDASVLLAKTTKADANLLAKTTKADSDLLAKITKASADLLAEETKASADLLAKETKNSAEELRKSNEVYISWMKWMTIVLIIVGFIQIALALIPLFKSVK